ncbi:DUF1513 domain-containing protein [Pseudoalteromonas sp. T1lg23B]|uniref:DUF1513 domain-containing protein n=1 Tax=Pseudoalteromonas sp. T1lg23B TaxID=2077097 RepID=UPI000CF7482B|nr:DUF1513 domain-containing protein [Pseudoalteromonas sp. T1lg23B]
MLHNKASDFISRRKFCKSLMVAGVGLCVMPVLTGCMTLKDKRFASAFSDNQGQHFVAWFDASGNILGQVRIADRAHDLCHIAQSNTLLAFSRRPGRAMYVIDMQSNKILSKVESANNQHFFGHGALSNDGQWLYTTENYFDESYKAYEGLIVVRNTHNFAVESQFPSGGIGPHQLAALAHEDTLVVANGGIHTHPASPRTKLNLDSMQPNLSYIDIASGKVVEQVQPADHLLSTRHLCLASDDSVYVGCQYQGAKHLVQPLIFAHQRGGQLNALSANDSQWMALKQYTASLAINEAQTTLAVTSPRGGVISYWHLKSGKLDKLETQSDCAGIAPLGDEFVASTGRGELVSYKSHTEYLLHWDNHMIKL